MTVKAYIPHDASGYEQAFEWAHERRAAIELVKGVWKSLHRSPRQYAVVVNVEHPCADAIVVGEDGLGVIEFKDYGGQLQGDNESEWTILLPSGKTKTIEAGHNNRFGSPLRQVRHYRWELKTLLEEAIRKGQVELPSWLPTAHLQTTVCFTQLVEWNKESFRIDQPGFRVTTLDTIHEWVLSLAFGGRRKLSQKEVATIVSSTLKGQPWTTVEAMLSVSDIPYGYLWVLDGDRETWRLVLDKNMMLIGRGVECGSLMLEEHYVHVSRVHAQIRHEGEQVVIFHGYQGQPSKNHTFVNGEQVDPDKGRVLQDNDYIVLGGYEDKNHTRPTSSSCVYAFA